MSNKIVSYLILSDHNYYNLCVNFKGTNNTVFTQAILKYIKDKLCTTKEKHKKLTL